MQIRKIRDKFVRSPKTSLNRASLQLGITTSTIHSVLRNTLHFTGYKLQLRHQIKPADKPNRLKFCVNMLDKIDNDPDFSKNIIFSDEATFHTSGHVNRHNVRIWAKQNPQEVVERVRGSPKVNVWCALASDRIIGPFFFAESTIKKENYLDMLENFAMPQILEVNEAVLFQQDGAPPSLCQDHP